MSVNLRNVDRRGAVGLARVVDLIEVHDMRGVPSAKYKVKVLERENDFLAVPNICVRNEKGVPEWTSGLGRTAAEALDDLLRQFDEVLRSRAQWEDADFEWSDPQDF